MEKRYKLAYRQTWSTLVDWKQLAIKDALSKGQHSRFYDEFVMEVARLAENIEVKLSECPEVNLPAYTEEIVEKV